MLPRVKIYFQNGALGRVTTPADGVLGLLCTGIAVADSFALATPYVLYSLDSLAALGVTSANNAGLYKIVSEFYAEAGNGAELWLMCFPDTVKMSDMVDVAVTDKAKALINAANGRLRGLVVSRTPDEDYTPTITSGLDADVALAMSKAQALSDWAANNKYAPVFVLIEGYAYDGNPVNLADLHSLSYNAVSILIGDTVASSESAAVGALAGRIASIPVQRNIGRVKDGPLAAVSIFIGDKAAEVADVETIHNKGYITFRTFIGRSGYFFNDDFTATAETDDYSSLTARRTIDKAYRLAYDALLDVLLDEVPVNNDGTLQAPIVKSWEAMVESRIANSMTVNGELSADVNNPNDRGVVAYIDPLQNIIADSILDVSVAIRPFGYPRYINIYLGFQVINS